MGGHPGPDYAGGKSGDAHALRYAFRFDHGPFGLAKEEAW